MYVYFSVGLHFLHILKNKMEVNSGEGVQHVLVPPTLHADARSFAVLTVYSPAESASSKRKVGSILQFKMKAVLTILGKLFK